MDSNVLCGGEEADEYSVALVGAVEGAAVEVG